MDTLDLIHLAEETLHAARKHFKIHFDEVAVLLDSPEAMGKFVMEAEQGGLTNFASVPTDLMRRQDKYGELFHVQFEFLRLHQADWRIEAMCVLDGVAPLHAALEKPSVVHLSYKLADLAEYQNEVMALRESTPMRAEYQNGYGVFSYWGPNGAPFIKPRVNLRDT